MTPTEHRAQSALTLWLQLKPDHNGPDPLAHMMADAALNAWLDAERAAWGEIASHRAAA